MDIAYIAKIICDLSLWFCASSFILSFFDLTAVTCWPAGLILLCCVLCYLLRNKKTPLRLAPLLGLLACGFWMHTVFDALLLVPPCLYCAWLCVKGLFTPDYSGSCSYFKTAAIVLPLLLLLAIVSGAGSRVQQYSLPYFIAFLFCGIAMLRLLRHGVQTRKEWRLWLVTLLSLVLVSAAALFLSSDLFLHAAGEALGALYRYIIRPLLIGLVYLMMGLVWLFEQVASLFRPAGSDSERTPQEIIEGMNSDLFETAETGGGELLRQILTALVIVAAAGAFIVLAFRLFRRMADAAGGAEEDTYTQKTHREPIRGSRARPAVRTLFSPRTPRETVRWYYRKFLLKAKAGGIDLKPSDTSESIERSARALFDPVLTSELRKIYIVARYSPETVTAGDAKKARELYGRLKTEPDEEHPPRHRKAHKA